MTDYFSLFSIEQGFDLDVPSLSITYRALQQKMHPDNYATASSQEQLLAVQKAAEINDAFQTLKDPVNRAEYILSLRGIDLKHESSTIKDMDFLMEQMQLREELERIEDSIDPEHLIDDFEVHLSTLLTTYIDSLSQSIAKDAQDSNHESADWVRKLKFLYKLEQELSEIEDKVSDH